MSTVFIFKMYLGEIPLPLKLSKILCQEFGRLRIRVPFPFKEPENFMQINQRKYLVHITESIPSLPQALWEVAATGLLIHVP